MVDNHELKAIGKALTEFRALILNPRNGPPLYLWFIIFLEFL